MPRSAVLFSTNPRPNAVSKQPKKKTRLPKKSRKGRVLVGRTTCGKCNKTLAYSSVTPHMNSFHPTSPRELFACTYQGCPQEFVSRTARFRHNIAVHHYEPRQRIMEVYRFPRYSPPPSDLRKTRYCPHCRVTHPTRMEFLRHKKACKKVRVADRADAVDPPPSPGFDDNETDEVPLPESPVIASARSQRILDSLQLGNARIADHQNGKRLAFLESENWRLGFTLDALLSPPPPPPHTSHLTLF